MGRTALAPYEVESIKLGPHPTKPGQLRARARYRTEVGGQLHDVYGTGKTKAAAERNLRKNLTHKRETFHGGSALITERTTVEAAAEVWLSERRSQKPALTARTLTDYGLWIDRYVKGTEYGGLPLFAAANPARAEQHLRAVANGEHRKDSHGGGEGCMRSTLKVLRGVFATAYRHGAIPHPVKIKAQSRTVPDDRAHPDTTRAFTREELKRIQVEADASSADIGDLVAFLSVTGARINEALRHVFWEDVNLSTGQVVIRGTKTKNALRVVLLPDWLCDRLKARADLWGTEGLVFGVTRFESKAGQPRDYSNVRTALKRVFVASGVPWATSHTFRRSVATLLAEGQSAGVGQIATLLGQEPRTTLGYIKKQAVGDAAALGFADPF